MTRIALGLICLISLFFGRARAETPETGEGPCIPTVSDYDSAYGFSGGDYAVIWWCPEERGLAAYWWTDTTAKSNPASVLRLAGRDPDEFRQQLEHRWSTVEQITLAMELQSEHGPRCWTGKLEVSCNSWRIIDGKHLCDVSGRIQQDGSVLHDTWQACEMTKAPQGGWK